MLNGLPRGYDLSDTLESIDEAAGQYITGLSAFVVYVMYDGGWAGEAFQCDAWSSVLVSNPVLLEEQMEQTCIVVTAEGFGPALLPISEYATAFLGTPE